MVELNAKDEKLEDDDAMATFLNTMLMKGMNEEDRHKFDQKMQAEKKMFLPNDT